MCRLNSLFISVGCFLHTHTVRVAAQSPNMLALLVYTRHRILGMLFWLHSLHCSICACMHTCGITCFQLLWLHSCCHHQCASSGRLVFACVWLVSSTFRDIATCTYRQVQLPFWMYVACKCTVHSSLHLTVVLRLYDVCDLGPTYENSVCHPQEHAKPDCNMHYHKYSAGGMLLVVCTSAQRSGCSLQCWCM